MANEPAPNNYIIAGDDDGGAGQPGAFAAANLYYKAYDNCPVLSIDKYPNLYEAIAHITLPANIILNCHGINDTNGNIVDQFVWHKEDVLEGRSPSYSQLFSALKELQETNKAEIKSITVDGCFGGFPNNADILALGPAGMIVQSQVSSQCPNWDKFITPFAEKAYNAKSSTDLLLAALSTFDPEKYKKYAADDVAQKPKDAKIFDYNPMHALPHIIGIAGDPPVIIDLEARIENLANKKTSLNSKAWIDATLKTYRAFYPTDVPTGASFSPSYIEKEMELGKTPNSDQYMDAINLMANKIEKGHMPVGVQEKRIAYALMAAYLDTSGELDKLVAHQIEVAKKQQQQPATTGPSTQSSAIPIPDPYAQALQHGAAIASVLTNAPAYAQSPAKLSSKDGKTPISL